jgi:hypothetical protein
MKTQYDLSKLTPEIVQELDKEPNIHEMFVRIGVVKNEIPFGSWVVDTEDDKWLMKYESGLRYGLDGAGKWFYDRMQYEIQSNDRIATPEEVEKRLIEYAKSIGFVEGVKFKDLKLDQIVVFDSSYSSVYYDSSNELWYGGYCIMKDGIWATIIKEETYIKIPLS